MVLETWRQMIDDGRGQDGQPKYHAHRAPRGAARECHETLKAGGRQGRRPGHHRHRRRQRHVHHRGRRPPRRRARPAPATCAPSAPATAASSSSRPRQPPRGSKRKQTNAVPVSKTARFPTIRAEGGNSVSALLGATSRSGGASQAVLTSLLVRLHAVQHLVRAPCGRPHAAPHRPQCARPVRPAAEPCRRRQAGPQGGHRRQGGRQGLSTSWRRSWPPSRPSSPGPVIPFGPEVKIPFTDTWSPLQLTDLPVAVLYILAVTSIGIYGIVLAGWSSGSIYALLGGMRWSAQMISDQVAR